jgi:hypothetical protein
MPPYGTSWSSVPNAGPFTIWRPETKRASAFESVPMYMPMWLM